MSKAVINRLERRIIELSYKHQLSHIGSCLTCLPIIYGIYLTKKREEKFCLSCGHSGLALYVVLEHFYGADAEQLLIDSGVHPDRSASKLIDCSTGSLGLGICIAVGMAIAQPDKKVYCVVSDGECAEGSVYEALNLKEKLQLNNLLVYCNYNGYAAYEKTHKYFLQKLPGMYIVDNSQHWFIQRYFLESHYKVLDDKEYQSCIR